MTSVKTSRAFDILINNVIYIIKIIIIIVIMEINFISQQY